MYYRYLQTHGHALKCIDISTPAGSNVDLIIDALLSSAAVGCPELRAVDIRGCSVVDSNVFKQLFTACAGIIRLSILQCDGTRMSQVVLDSVAEHCTSLLCLELEEAVISTVAFATMVSRCPYLTMLDISTCPYIDDSSFIQVAKHCRYIDTLTVNNVISDVSIIALATNCRNLQSILLRTDERTAVTDLSVLAIAQHCPNLVELVLYMCDGVTDQSIIAIAKQCPRLRKIVLSLVPNVTDSAVCALAEHSRYLQRVSLLDSPHVTDAGLHALYRQCDYLQCVNVDRYITNVSDKLVQLFGDLLVHQLAYDEEYYTVVAPAEVVDA